MNLKLKNLPKPTSFKLPGGKDGIRIFGIKITIPIKKLWGKIHKNK